MWILCKALRVSGLLLPITCTWQLRHDANRELSQSDLLFNRPTAFDHRCVCGESWSQSAASIATTPSTISDVSADQLRFAKARWQLAGARPFLVQPAAISWEPPVPDFQKANGSRSPASSLHRSATDGGPDAIHEQASPLNSKAHAGATTQ